MPEQNPYQSPSYIPDSETSGLDELDGQEMVLETANTRDVGLILILIGIAIFGISFVFESGTGAKFSSLVTALAGLVLFAVSKK